MKKLTAIIFINIFIYSAVSCEKDYIEKQTHLTEEQRQELRERRAKFKEQRKGDYSSFKAVASSREEAVKNLLEALRTGQEKDLDLFLITREEYENMLWPHFPEEQTLAIGNTFDNYWTYQETRRDIGLTDLRRMLKGLKEDEYKINDLVWDPEVRTYGPFKGHILKHMNITVKGNTDNNRSIRFVVEYKGKFKVAGLSR